MFTLALAAALLKPVDLELNTASKHPIQYYESMPKGWKPGGKWPVLVVIESANREFERNTLEFVIARRDLPFIIVAPLVLTNGGSRVKDVPTYQYDDTTWARIGREGPWKFDSDGLQAILRDVEKDSGKGPVYWTAWEAGCHTLWAVCFGHPDWVKAAALVSPNYQGRWVAFAQPPVDGGPLMRVFGGGEDPGWAAGQPLFDQTESAKKAATEHGFTKVSSVVVPGRGHGAMAEDVVSWFATLQSNK